MIQRLTVGLVCALASAIELWLFGEDVGGIVVSSVILGLAYVLCSSRARKFVGLLKIALVLCGATFFLDAIGAFITKAIDGEASVAGGSRFATAILVWIAMDRSSRFAHWIGVGPVDSERAHG